MTLLGATGFWKKVCWSILSSTKSWRFRTGILLLALRLGQSNVKVRLQSMTLAMFLRTDRQAV